MPQARSIDGLEGPPVKRGQEALIELLSNRDPEEDEEGETVPDAPRCFCKRQARLRRVQVPGPPKGRRCFVCPAKNCRFMSFGEQPSSSEAQALKWLPFKTGRALAGVHRLVVLGQNPRPVTSP